MIKIKIKKKESIDNILKKIKINEKKNNLLNIIKNKINYIKPSYKKYLKKKNFIKKEQIRLRKKYYIIKYL